MGSHLEDELTLHIEFRNDWRKIDEGQLDKKSQQNLSKYIITERSDGYVQYERDIEIDGGPVGSDTIREIDHLQIRRANFRIEIHPRLGSTEDWKRELKVLYEFFSKMSEEFARDLCKTEGGEYFIFTLGKNYQDINNSKETQKFRGHCYFQFDNGFENLFIVPGVRKLFRQKDIMQETNKMDWPQTQIFFRSFSTQALRGAFAKFIRMNEIAIELQIQLNEVYSSFAKTVSWRKKGNIRIRP